MNIDQRTAKREAGRESREESWKNRSCMQQETALRADSNKGKQLSRQGEHICSPQPRAGRYSRENRGAAEQSSNWGIISCCRQSRGVERESRGESGKTDHECCKKQHCKESSNKEIQSNRQGRALEQSVAGRCLADRKEEQLEGQRSWQGEQRTMYSR